MGINIGKLDINLSHKSADTVASLVQSPAQAEEIDARLLDAHKAINSGNLTEYERFAHSSEKSERSRKSESKERVSQMIQ